MALFDARRHEALTAEPWNDAAARAAVRRIAADALAAFDPRGLWPAHAQDDPATPDERHTMLYMGAGGVIWALERLRRLGAIGPLGADFRPTVDALVERNHVLLAAWSNREGAASYFMGDAGLLLLQWQHGRDAAVADRLHAVVAGNIGHPANEALWGSPGTMLAALHMAEATGEARWSALFARAASAHVEAMVHEPALDAWLWVQDLYGSTIRYLGAGHGFAGNVYPVLRGAARLPGDLVARVAERALQTLQATVWRVDGLANWEPAWDPDGRMPSKLLVQDCHGAPGIVCRLAAGAPRTAPWDTLLAEAGELTWSAGPLAKGAGLCHGSAGNGYALLKLWQRTGDAAWLQRARAFAMHAIAQVDAARAAHGRGRYSLWTGDVGVALYVWDCVQGGAELPMLDVF